MDRSKDRRPEPELPNGVSDVLGPDDAFGRALARWAADATVDDAVRGRVRARWLRIQAEEEASFGGTLVDLAERGRPVVLDVGPHRLQGLLAGVGGDFVALRTDRGHDVLIRLDGIDAVRPEPGSTAVRGDRTATLEVTLDAVLGPIAAERPEVLIRTDRDVAVRGQLRSAGTDVLRLRAAGDPATPVWVPLDAVRMIVLDVETPAFS